MSRSLTHHSRDNARVRAVAEWMHHPAYLALEMARYRADCKGLYHGTPARAAYIAADLYFAHEIRVLIAKRHGAPL